VTHFLRIGVLVLVSGLFFANGAQAESVKDHYVQLFENGRIPQFIPFGQHIVCADVTNPSTGFAGSFFKQGSSVVLLSTQDKPYDIEVPSGNVLRGKVSMLRQAQTGELILIGINSFFGIRPNVDPDDLDAWRVQVLLCDTRAGQ
jgi:hypothetical protein